MTQDKNQKENEFKLKILRQLKDRDSALNTFLSKLDPEDTDYGDLVPKCNHLLRVPEFNMELEFTWDESISYERSDTLKFNHGNGGHHVAFSKMSDDSLGLDISEIGYIKTLPFFEEVIIPSVTNPNAITLGIMPFRITHEAYEFERLPNFNIFKSIDFSLTTLDFLGDIRQKIEEWNELLEDSWEDNEMTYIQYFIKNERYNALENHFKSVLSDEARQKGLLDIVSHEWRCSIKATRLGCIAHALKNKK